jgi:heme/copper-type cytochrome/quinol oxidase subunit 2
VVTNGAQVIVRGPKFSAGAANSGTTGIAVMGTNANITFLTDDSKGVACDFLPASQKTTNNAEVYNCQATASCCANLKLLQKPVLTAGEEIEQFFTKNMAVVAALSCLLFVTIVVIVYYRRQAKVARHHSDLYKGTYSDTKLPAVMPNTRVIACSALASVAWGQAPVPCPTSGDACAKACPSSTPVSAFGSGCCGGSPSTTACSAGGGECTAIGCNRFSADDFKKCAAQVSQGCYRDSDYVWPQAAWNAFSGDGRYFCPVLGPTQSPTTPTFMPTKSDTSDINGGVGLFFGTIVTVIAAVVAVTTIYLCKTTERRFCSCRKKTKEEGKDMEMVP